MKYKVPTIIQADAKDVANGVFIYGNFFDKKVATFGVKDSLLEQLGFDFQSENFKAFRMYDQADELANFNADYVFVDSSATDADLDFVYEILSGESDNLKEIFELTD